MKKMLSIGDIVKIREPFNGYGDWGYVYENYTDFDDATKTGASIITSDGKDLGGFSYKEQLNYLSFVEFSHFVMKEENIFRIRIYEKTHYLIETLFSEDKLKSYKIIYRKRIIKIVTDEA